MVIHVQLLYLASLVAVWIVTYHIAYWLVALSRDSTLVFWSVGPFGVSGVSFREPPVSRVFAQLIIAGGWVALLAYASLFMLTPAPVAGLDRTVAGKSIAVAIPVLVITLLRVIAIVLDRRFPVWGEARVLAQAQRSVATGARIFFTPLGRAFLRERFDTTPNEFLRTVRF